MVSEWWSSPCGDVKFSYPLLTSILLFSIYPTWAHSKSHPSPKATFTRTLVNVVDLRRNSGEYEECAGECCIAGFPNFAELHQTLPSFEGMRMLPVPLEPARPIVALFIVLQTRPPGTDVKSTDLAQSALERAHKALADIGAKRLVALARHGGARAQTSSTQVQVTFGRLLVPRPKRPFAPLQDNFRSFALLSSGTLQDTARNCRRFSGLKNQERQRTFTRRSDNHRLCISAKKQYYQRAFAHSR